MVDLGRGLEESSTTLRVMRVMGGLFRGDRGSSLGYRGSSLGYSRSGRATEEVFSGCFNGMWVPSYIEAIR